MAYGLDVEELYYADHQLVDKGILTTYKISLDIADEKEFELETPDFVMEADDFWYVPNTELGGIIDAYETNSEDGIVKPGEFAIASDMFARRNGLNINLTSRVLLERDGYDGEGGHDYKYYDSF